MLLQRVITAVVLLAVLMPALFAASPWPFAMVTLVMIAAATWEWARLNGVALIAAVGPAVLIMLAGLWALSSGAGGHLPMNAWGLVTAAWVLGGAWALHAGPGGWASFPALLRLLLGLLLLWVGWLALVQARAASINFVLSALCVVWVADIGAYFAGRQFGRRKLAPTISPGKTWEGVFGGLIGVAVLGLAWMAWVDPSLPFEGRSVFAHLRDRWGWVGYVVTLGGLTGLSVMGDLFESLVKRAAGAKDSSRLLPGHGGVLDRIDALLPVMPAALAFGAL
jgi:phosphatidate cytidylyltransferase